MTAQTATPEFKRLAFIPQTSQKALELASSLYSTGKVYVPESLRPQVQAIEGRVVGVASPYSSKLLERATEVLVLADSKVDSSIKAAYERYAANSEYLASAVEKQREAHKQNLESFQAARKEYLSKVENSLAFVKEQGLQGAAKAASDVLLTRVEEAKKAPAALLDSINKAWHDLLELPAVSALLEGSKKQVGAAFAAYTKTHDTLVASPTYGKVVEKGGEVLKTVQATSLYQAAAVRLYPLAAPYVEPALTRAQPYLDRAAAHLAPAAAPAAA